MLASPAETGAVTLALPQDTQSEAYDYPEALFKKRIWTIPRVRPDRELLAKAAGWIRKSRKAILIAGGGVHYSDALDALAAFVEGTGIPVGETQAGKGSLRYDHPCALGSIGVTGTPGANILAREADLVIAVGTRFSDFTTASKTAFQNPDIRFIGINVVEFDAAKHAALPLVGDARMVLEELAEAVAGYRVPSDLSERVNRFHRLSCIFGFQSGLRFLPRQVSLRGIGSGRPAGSLHMRRDPFLDSCPDTCCSCALWSHRQDKGQTSSPRFRFSKWHKQGSSNV